ncbi:MAG: hypothetical protein H0V93_08705 [Euzebyales bacterium]|jgi:predicted nucleic acid-binding protein|nr:hypothetical protein [Euzebyales bacterium]
MRARHLGSDDCSTVVLARRLQTRAIHTFDERHLHAVEPPRRSAITLLPADA